MPENKKDAEANDEQSVHQRAEGASSSSEQDALKDLDLDNLDLSIETVEERISPSETNVFDK